MGGGRVPEYESSRDADRQRRDKSPERFLPFERTAAVWFTIAGIVLGAGTLVAIVA